MTRVLYDLAGADEDLRFSPFCWRVKLALAHKNLDFETVPWRFTDKEAIAFSGQGKVPVLVDGDSVVSDSHDIAIYLEENYPNEASLFGDHPGPAFAYFVKAWTESVLHSTIVPVVIHDIFHHHLAPQDQPYFRQTREAYYKRTLEDFAAQRDEALATFHAALKPVYAVLKVQPFLSGDAPAYPDHIVFGALQWARLTSSTKLFSADDPISIWMLAVLEAYDL
jgi:glutathione S-transferase